jgi:hypothetical protein
MCRKIEIIAKPGAIFDRSAHTPGFDVLRDEMSILFLHF